MGKRKDAVVSIRMNSELASKLDDMAKRSGISRSQLACNLVTMGVQSLSRADKLGMLSLAILLRDFEYNLKAWVRNIKVEGKELAEDWANGCYEEDLEELLNEEG